MPIFDYNNYSDPKETYDNPHKLECIYCSSKLNFADIEDIWGEIDNNRVLEIQKGVHEGYKEIHGLEDYYLNLNMDTKDEEVSLHYCQVCGWWRVVKDVCVCAEEWQIWDIFLVSLAPLKLLT